MQNAFCSPGGYLDQIGFDLTRAEVVVETVREVLGNARRIGIPIFHGQNGIRRDLSDISRDSSWWAKSPALRHRRAHPERNLPLLAEDTWDFAFREEVAPLPGEVVLRKSRPSCFAGTDLDARLRQGGINTIFVVGIASNVGVEWTLREGLSRNFFPVMIEMQRCQQGPTRSTDP